LTAETDLLLLPLFLPALPLLMVLIMRGCYGGWRRQSFFSGFCSFLPIFPFPTIINDEDLHFACRRHSPPLQISFTERLLTHSHFTKKGKGEENGGEIQSHFPQLFLRCVLRRLSFLLGVGEADKLWWVMSRGVS
jgi:hypothetical protein